MRRTVLVLYVPSLAHLTQVRRELTRVLQLLQDVQVAQIFPDSKVSLPFPFGVGHNVYGQTKDRVLTTTADILRQGLFA